MHLDQNEPLAPTQAYKHCPKCAGDLKHMGNNMLRCTKCGYNLFINAAPAAGAIITNDMNEVLFVKRKFEPYKGTWQLPGGFMNPEETYEDALHREIEEELGVKIQIKKFAGTIPMPYPYGGVAIPVLCIYSVAKIIAGKITPRDDVEEVAFLADKKTNETTLTFPPQSALAFKAIDD